MHRGTAFYLQNHSLSTPNWYSWTLIKPVVRSNKFVRTMFVKIIIPKPFQIFTILSSLNQFGSAWSINMNHCATSSKILTKVLGKTTKKLLGLRELSSQSKIDSILINSIGKGPHKTYLLNIYLVRSILKNCFRNFVLWSLLVIPSYECKIKWSRLFTIYLFTSVLKSVAVLIVELNWQNNALFRSIVRK